MFSPSWLMSQCGTSIPVAISREGQSQWMQSISTSSGTAATSSVSLMNTAVPGNLRGSGRRGSQPGQNLVRIDGMLSRAEPPSREQLVDDLKLLREKGLSEIDDLDLPALTAASLIVVSAGPEPDEAALVETLLRRAVSRVGGGKLGDSAQALFGLDGDTRTLTSGVRRGIAADRLGVSIRTFRRNHEDPMLNQVARQILVLCAEQQQREGRGRLAAAHPVESGIALHWIERFEAYYQLWTPIYALAADLTAYRSTMIEDPRPYDRRFGTDAPDDSGYSQDEQADGYARDALYHYAFVEWGLRRFMANYGALWMLSEADIETEVSDATYRIRWHVNPFNERDQSFLRTLIDETPGQELHGFLERLAASDLGRQTHQEWLDWCATCSCTWDASAVPEADYFPTAKNQEGISTECQVHQVIGACGLYCDLIDKDWRKIADWYHLDDKAVSKGASAERLYAEWRSTPSGAEYKAPGA